MFRSVLSIRTFCGLIFGAFLLSDISFPVQSVEAADAASDDIDYPLGIVSVASLQRIRDSAAAMFESIDRKDMTEIVDQWTIDTLKDAQGIDRNRPVGAMIYLNTQEFIRPMAISYIPVSNLDEALQTLAYDVGTISPVEGNAARRDINYDQFKLRTLYRDHYLFLVGPDGSDADLDRNFPDPEKLTGRLTTQYDFGLSLIMKGIPPGMRILLMQAVKTQATADLQQRDDEPESVYRLRRANGEYWIDLFEKIVNQGQEITFGTRMDAERKTSFVDLEIVGTSDSKLAKFFQNMAGKRSWFGNLLSSPSTFAMSVSWALDEKQRKPFITYFEAAQRDLEKAETTGGGGDNNLAGLAEIVKPLFKTFIATADTGHLDAFAQIDGTEREKFVMLAGIKLAASRNLPAQFTELLNFVKKLPNGNELTEKLELEVDAIDGFPVHRISINPPDDGGQRMFGKEAQLYLYSGPQAIWVAFGGETALETLRQSIDTVALPQNPQQGRNRVPFQFTTHAKNWLSLANTERPGGDILADRANASFESDNDTMKLEIRPTETGVRLRAEFESGFIMLMGRNISETIDERMSKREEPDPAPPKFDEAK